MVRVKLEGSDIWEGCLDRIVIEDEDGNYEGYSYLRVVFGRKA